MTEAVREDLIGNRAKVETMSAGRFWFALGACLIGIAILVGLGTWQVERLYWKEAMIERIDARIHAPPVDFDALKTRFATTGDVDYTPVKLTGHFLHEEERYFLSTFEGQAGWNVFTPLLVDEGELIFVNRGFVPYELRDPARRPEGLTQGVVAIEGLARNAQDEKPGYFVPENDPEGDIFYWRDLPAMAAGLPAEARARDLLPFSVDAGPTPGAQTYPVGGTTVVSIPNNHLQYAITWYGIAIVLAVMTGMLVWRRVRPRRGAG